MFGRRNPERAKSLTPAFPEAKGAEPEARSGRETPGEDDPPCELSRAVPPAHQHDWHYYRTGTDPDATDYQVRDLFYCGSCLATRTVARRTTREEYHQILAAWGRGGG